MQCLRCTEELADDCTECPVCHKLLTPRAQTHVRVALTGEAYDAANFPLVRAATIHTTPPTSPVESVQAPAPPPVHLIPTHPERFPGPRRAATPVQSRTSLAEWRWLIVAFAVAGVIASAVLFHRPYVAPVYVGVQTTGTEIALNGEHQRAIPAIYLWLWGAYCLLAVATQVYLPAPWRFGPLNLRTNWVLNATTVLTILLFTGSVVGQNAEGYLQREVVYREGGELEYHNGNEVRTVTPEEAARINARIIQDREIAIYKQWNMAALLSFLALGVYAAWWIIERPVADTATPMFDVAAFLRRMRSEPVTTSTLDDVETLPSENARPREPAPGNIPWR